MDDTDGTSGGFDSDRLRVCPPPPLAAASWCAFAWACSWAMARAWAGDMLPLGSRALGVEKLKADEADACIEIELGDMAARGEREDSSRFSDARFLALRGDGEGWDGAVSVLGDGTLFETLEESKDTE